MSERSTILSRVLKPDSPEAVVDELRPFCSGEPWWRELGHSSRPRNEVQSLVANWIEKLCPKDWFRERVDGSLPLHDAAGFFWNLPVVERVYAKYPDAAAARDKDGNTPLHLVLGVDEATFLYKKYPAAALMRNSMGCIPLHKHIADYHVVPEMITPEACWTQDMSGKTPLESLMLGDGLFRSPESDFPEFCECLKLVVRCCPEAAQRRGDFSLLYEFFDPAYTSWEKHSRIAFETFFELAAVSQDDLRIPTVALSAAS